MLVPRNTPTRPAPQRAAAARAATLGLLSGEVPASVVCHLPNGQDVSFAVSEGRIVDGDHGDHANFRKALERIVQFVLLV